MLLFYFFFIQGSEELLAQIDATGKEITVGVLRTSKGKKSRTARFSIEGKAGKSKGHRSGTKVKIHEGDRIVCKNWWYVDMSVTVKNIGNLDSINLYLNSPFNGKKGCSEDHSKMRIKGRIYSEKNSYSICSNNNECASVNRDNPFSECFTKIDRDRNQLKVFIKKSTTPKGDFNSADSPSKNEFLTLIVDHEGGTGKDDDSDLTIDVFIDDDGIVKQPK